MICPTDPPDFFFKIEKSRKKIEAKAIQEHLPWRSLEKIFQIIFSQYMHINAGTPQFRSMPQAENTKYSCTQSAGDVPKWFASLIKFHFGLAHLASILDPSGCQGHGQIVDNRTAKSVQNKRHFCCYCIYRRFIT